MANTRYITSDTLTCNSATGGYCPGLRAGFSTVVPFDGAAGAVFPAAGAALEEGLSVLDGMLSLVPSFDPTLVAFAAVVVVRDSTESAPALLGPVDLFINVLVPCGVAKGSK